MKFATTYLRNRVGFKDYFDGMVLPVLMEKYTVTKTMPIMQSIGAIN